MHLIHLSSFCGVLQDAVEEWGEFFKDLKHRGLDGREMQLGIMDGLPGLEKVFTEEFTNAKIHRRQVHGERNVLAKIPKRLKQDVADNICTIFYASSKRKAKEYFERFRNRWGKELPSVVKCLKRSIENCLTFFHFPQQEWICLRTTNVIELLNKEFKCRTKPMEIVASERACYTLLAFICLKMELHWRTCPMGKRPVIYRHYKIWSGLISHNRFDCTSVSVWVLYFLVMIIMQAFLKHKKFLLYLVLHLTFQ